MRLSKRLQDALNAQINAEFWSAYLYLSMSADAASKGHKGVANWFQVQFQEEQAHARILMNHLLSRGGKVELAPIEKVDTEWPSVMAMYEQTLTHERKVTDLIHNLFALATEEHDYAAVSMLGWFVDEQVEEEESAQDLIDQLKAGECDKLALYLIDRDLATRTYTEPSPLAGKA